MERRLLISELEGRVEEEGTPQAATQEEAIQEGSGTGI